MLYFHFFSFHFCLSFRLTLEVFFILIGCHKKLSQLELFLDKFWYLIFIFLNFFYECSSIFWKIINPSFLIHFMLSFQIKIYFF